MFGKKVSAEEKLFETHRKLSESAFKDALAAERRGLPMIADLHLQTAVNHERLATQSPYK